MRACAICVYVYVYVYIQTCNLSLGNIFWILNGISGQRETLRFKSLLQRGFEYLYKVEQVQKERLRESHPQIASSLVVRALALDGDTGEQMILFYLPTESLNHSVTGMLMCVLSVVSLLQQCLAVIPMWNGEVVVGKTIPQPVLPASLPFKKIVKDFQCLESSACRLNLADLLQKNPHSCKWFHWSPRTCIQFLYNPILF